MLRQKAKSIGLSLSEYLKEIGLKGQTVRQIKVLPKEVLSFTATLNHIAANINQIAKNCNAYNFLSAGEKKELELLTEALKQLAVEHQKLPEMIGKITTGKSLRGCLLYCLNDKRKQNTDEVVFKNRAEIILFNKCFGNQKELIQQFNDVRQLNMNLSKPLLHITLNFAEGEHLNSNPLREISEACAREFGFENNQFVAILHKDTDHRHLHIVANRIGFDRRTVSDSNSYKRMVTFCRKMELKYNLKQVLSPNQFVAKEQRQSIRSDIRKLQMKEHIRQALQTCGQFADFQMKMKQKGYRIIKGRGIAFVDAKKVYVKGSELGYSLQTIERQLQQNSLRRTPKQTLHEITMQPGTPAIQIRETEKQHANKDNQGISKSICNAIEHLLKPEFVQQQEATDEAAIRKLKKKKRRSLHL